MWASQVALAVKDLPANAGNVRDARSIPGTRRSPEGGHGNPLQCSCLENPCVQRGLAGYSPRGHKEVDLTEGLNTASLVLAFTRLPEMPSFYEFNCHSISDPRRQLLPFPAGVFFTSWMLTSTHCTSFPGRPLVAALIWP